MASNGLTAKDEKVLAAALAKLNTLYPVRFLIGGKEERELTNLIGEIESRVAPQEPEALIQRVDTLMEGLMQLEWAREKFKAA